MARSRVLSRLAALSGALALITAPLAALGAAAPAAAAPASGGVTSVPFTPGKGQGSGQWGYVGDIETIGAGGATYNYGLAFDPATHALWVTDSGKVNYSSFGCYLAVGTSAPCQLGTPRAFIYDRVTADDSMGDYRVDGAYLVNGNGDPSRNDGIGARYEAVGDRTTITAPFQGGSPNVTNGPRGVDVAADGSAWIVNSESQQALTDAPGASLRFDSAGNLLGGAGWGQAGAAGWANRDKPGVHFYRTGVSATPQGTVLVNTETSRRLQEYAPDGTWLRSIPLDVAPGTLSPADNGYRSPYSVAVDPVDGTIYTAIDFQSANYPTIAQTPVIERRDRDGALLATFGGAQLQKSATVMGISVNPANRHVFAWNQTGAVHEWTADGAFVRDFAVGTTPGTFPGLTTVRDLVFDEAGRMYLTVAEGTGRARVMILAQTPGPVTTACARWTADRTSVELSWACDPAMQPATAQVPVKDYVIEQSTDGGTSWTVVPHAAASTETTRTLTGLDPAATYLFRVSAWNEAGNGDWRQFSDPTAIAGMDDSATTAWSTPVTANVLANDAGDRGDVFDPASLALVGADGAPTKRLEVAGEGAYDVVDGAISFTPEAGFAGAAAPVTYTAAGDCSTVSAKLSVTVAPPEVGAITVSTWLDANGDGVRGSDDGPLPGIAAKLSGTSVLGEAIERSGTSDAGGQISWGDVPPGTYTVTVAGGAEYTITVQGADSQVSQADGTARVTLGQGASASVAAGFAPTPTPTPTPTETPTPTDTPTPTGEPTDTPTPEPTDTPMPTDTPTTTPTDTPTTTPTDTPAPTPTDAPTETAAPTTSPTHAGEPPAPAPSGSPVAPTATPESSGPSGALAGTGAESLAPLLVIALAAIGGGVIAVRRRRA